VGILHEKTGFPTGVTRDLARSECQNALAMTASRHGWNFGEGDGNFRGKIEKCIPIRIHASFSANLATQSRNGPNCFLN
jgi:hypothetical protein